MLCISVIPFHSDKYLLQLICMSPTQTGRHRRAGTQTEAESLNGRQPDTGTGTDTNADRQVRSPTKE